MLGAWHAEGRCSCCFSKAGLVSLRLFQQSYWVTESVTETQMGDVVGFGLGYLGLCQCLYWSPPSLLSSLLSVPCWLFLLSGISVDINFILCPHGLFLCHQADTGARPSCWTSMGTSENNSDVSICSLSLSLPSTILGQDCSAIIWDEEGQVCLCRVHVHLRGLR